MNECHLILKSNNKQVSRWFELIEWPLFASVHWKTQMHIKSTLGLKRTKQKSSVLVGHAAIVQINCSLIVVPMKSIGLWVPSVTFEEVGSSKAALQVESSILGN